MTVLFPSDHMTLLAFIFTLPLFPHSDRGLGRDVTSATLDSGRGITGGGSGYAAIWRTRDEFCTVWNSAR